MTAGTTAAPVASASIATVDNAVMELVISAGGRARCVYAEAIDLPTLGDLRITRASHVEPDESGRWWADLAPVGGPRLGPFATRSVALAAEARWLAEHWLGAATPARA